MLKTFKYRMYPSKKQEGIQNNILEQCRVLYNYFIEERKINWEKEHKSISYFDQQNQLPLLKQSNSNLKNVNAQVLQNVAVRVDLAFKAFFRRVKAGEKPGYPRFKGKGNYDSFTYPQANTGCCSVSGKNKLYLSKIGDVKVKYHRPLEGKIKTCTVKRTRSGKWFVCFVCDVKTPDKLPESILEVGIDVGLLSFAYFSDGNKIKNPRFFKQEEKELARVQRKLSRIIEQEKKDKIETPSEDRIKARKVVSKIHERIANKRNNFSDQESRKIVDKYGFIAIENLEVNRMKSKDNKKNGIRLSKSISDVAWSTFFQKLIHKAENAGRTVQKVNPAYTSQTCSGCEFRQGVQLSDRTYNCLNCNLSLNRDLNAAKNILKIGLGQQSKGSQINPKKLSKTHQSFSVSCQDFHFEAVYY